MNEQAFPLSWPEHWPRTVSQRRQSSRFYGGGQFGTRNYRRRHSMSEVVEFLFDELRRLGASNGIVSTNVKLRLDGQPYSNLSQPFDTGAAVYFKLNGKPISLACDKWNRVECNVYAIGKHIEALRGQERWGVGKIEQAFRGYMAIPERATGERWQDVLGLPINPTEEQVVAAWRTKVKLIHKEGGDHEAMVKVNLAYDEAKKLFAPKSE